jgi:hypothetical protein
MSDNQIEVAIRANATQYIAGMKEAGSVTQSAAASMSGEITKIGSASREAGNPLESMTHHIRSMRQEMRLSNFMAGQIAELGVASKGAAGEVTGLVAAFAMGNFTGLAIEGVLMLGKHIAEMAAEESHATEEIKKFGQAAAEQTAKVTDQVEKMLMSIKGATKEEAFFHDTVVPMLAKEFDLKQQLMTANAALSDAEAKAQPYVEANYHTKTEQAKALEAFTKKQREEVEKLTAALEAQHSVIENANTGLNKVQGADDAKKALDDSEKLQDEWNQYRQQSYEKDLADWQKHLVDAEKAQQDHLLRLSKAEFEAAKAIQKMLDDQDKVRLERQLQIEAQEDAEQQQRARTDEARLGSDFSQRHERASGGGGRVAERRRGDQEPVRECRVRGDRRAHPPCHGVDCGLDCRRAAAKAEALSHDAGPHRGGGRGRRGVASLHPFRGSRTGGLGIRGGCWGPGGLVTAPLLSASGGMERVPRDGMLTQLHKDETVLPAYIATPMREAFAEGRGGGGGSVTHFTSTPWTAPAVQPRGRGPALPAARMREAKRNGLLRCRTLSSRCLRARRSRTAGPTTPTASTRPSPARRRAPRTGSRLATATPSTSRRSTR